VGLLSANRKLLLGIVGIATVVGPVAFGIGKPVVEVWFAAENSAQLPSFEVASVRADYSGLSFNSRITAGRFVMERWRVKDLIEYSYDVKEPQVLGGPKWIESERYDVEAKLQDSDVTKEQNLPHEERISQLRVRELLSSRFGLKVHRSVKDLPVLALVVAKNGPRFAEAKASSNTDADKNGRQVNMTMDGKELVLSLENAPLRYLALALSGQPEIEGRILVDKTRLTGNYTLKLKWEKQDLATASGASERSGPTLFTALQEELGLKLESRKEPIDVVVIDTVERPSQN